MTKTSTRVGGERGPPSRTQFPAFFKLFCELSLKVTVAFSLPCIFLKYTFNLNILIQTSTLTIHIKLKKESKKCNTLVLLLCFRSTSSSRARKSHTSQRKLSKRMNERACVSTLTISVNMCTQKKNNLMFRDTFCGNSLSTSNFAFFNPISSRFWFPIFLKKQPFQTDDFNCQSANSESLGCE